jgi:hypothetical protein
MHITPETVDAMDILELERLRDDLRLPKARLCRAADIAPSTYQRWFLHVRGEPGGTSPRRTSLRAVREFLKDEVRRRGGCPVSQPRPPMAA